MGKIVHQLDFGRMTQEACNIWQQGLLQDFTGRLAIFYRL